MPKTDFVPASDHDFLVWSDHFVAKLSPEYGVADTDLATLKAAITEFHSKTDHLSEATAAAKQATAEKSNARNNLETLVRAEARRIKARSSYDESQGMYLGIQGHLNTLDMATMKPILLAEDQSGGKVSLSFTKSQSDGIRIYCRRETDADWVKLDRALTSPFLDDRPLLQMGKVELRRYTAVYMSKDTEIGQYSDEVVISCAP